MTNTGVSNKSIKKAHFSKSSSHKNNETLLVNDKANDKKEPCSDYVLHTLEQANQALTYKDFGTVFSYGTLRNEMSEHVTNGKVLKLPRENPARFILPEWASKPEYSCIQKNDNKGIGVRFDFLSYLEGLGWDSVPAVHDLRLSFAVYSLRWKDSGWEYCKRSHSYRRCFNLSYPVSVQCFDTGTVLVSIKATVRPFKLDCDGLLSLASLLGEVRNCLHAPGIPEPSTWAVVQWHFNRDSEKILGSGVSFSLTFRDFFHDLARVYYKHELDRVRAEAIQSPKRTLKEVFEEILNRDNDPRRGDS
jgi:hypothetical protein